MVNLTVNFDTLATWLITSKMLLKFVALLFPEPKFHFFHGESSEADQDVAIQRGRFQNWHVCYPSTGFAVFCVGFGEHMRYAAFVFTKP